MGKRVVVVGGGSVVTVKSVDCDLVGVVARGGGGEGGLLEVAVRCSLEEGTSRGGRVVEGGHRRGRREELRVALRSDLEELR